MTTFKYDMFRWNVDRYVCTYMVKDERLRYYQL